MAGDDKRRGRVKCVVWDLDNTLWKGVLLEGDPTEVDNGVLECIRRLDEVGVLHSIASKNDEDAALAKLRELGIEDLFLMPQINWNAKSHSVRRIAEGLRLGLDALAFVDDQDFERAEVAAGLPEVMCLDVTEIEEAMGWPEFMPRFFTGESKRRRAMYRTQLVRDDEEAGFVGTSDEFLATLDMTLVIGEAGPEDLLRAEELTVRTNQLNATGRTYSYEELDMSRRSDDHLLLVAGLSDKFGSYGTIGLALVETGTPDWHLRLLLMSCRVMSRGVGTVLLGHVMRLAGEAGRGLLADFVETGRNRMMRITYGFAGFEEERRDGTGVTLRADPARSLPPPPYLRLDVG